MKSFFLPLRSNAIFMVFSTSTAVFSHTKPNILWVTIEDTSPHFIGCYGNAAASTPNIDSLAADGVRFNNAFSTGTVSSASRSCIITGVKTYKTGTGNHRSTYPIPEYMKAFPYFLKNTGYYTTNNSKTDYNVGNLKTFLNEAWNENSGKAGWWNRKPGQPFFAVFNYMDSHQSRTMTFSYKLYKDNVLDKLSPEEIISENSFEMPPFYNDSPEMRKQVARVFNSIKLTDNKIGELLKRLESDHLRDSTIIFFYADHGEGIPRGKTNGINLGYRVPFIICVPEMYKHLSPWGSAGVITDELVDFEDLAPTLISLVDGEIPEYMTGRPIMGKKRQKAPNHLILSSDRSDNGIDLIRTVTDGRYLYSRNFMPFMPPARYIRYMEIAEIKQQMRKDLSENRLNPLQQSLFNERPAEYLYDLKNDKWETINLAEGISDSPVLERMRKLLRQEIITSHDVMLLPEYEIAEISKTTTPYEFRLNTKKYHIKEVFSAAQLSGLRGKEVAKKQFKLLKSNNCYVRYWAILGLMSQHADVLRNYKTELAQAMNDTYPPVAVTASAIVYREFAMIEAQENMKNYCRSDNMHLALMAINYLLYTPEKQPFISTIQELRCEKGKSYDVKAACCDFLSLFGLVPADVET